MTEKADYLALSLLDAIGYGMEKMVNIQRLRNASKADWKTPANGLAMRRSAG